MIVFADAHGFLDRFLAHPTWPAALVISVLILAIAWVAVTFLR